MKKQILSLLDKRTNRLERLNKFRRVNSLTTNGVGNFEIEISPKAKNKLNDIDKTIYFNFEHDFGIKEGTEEAYWVRVNGECPEKKTDFTYLATGKIRKSQHSGIDNWGITILFDHIDLSCNWRQLNVLVEMIAKWIDKKYGNDCGFEDKWRVKEMNIDFINNKSN